ncbi:MAG TPA: Gmad2 immunoglobulin-like domain-containing protein [Thermoanaerobaculia bacterium]|nr:Gmad2 immunoglobulin-like domain-containing protein [Thermoanaerobaculia bacterium]
MACSPAPPAEPAGTAPPTTAAQPEIAISSVIAANPVIVEGRARTFENNVVIRLIDSRGELIRETFTTSLGDIGRRNPFRAEVFVTRDPGAKLTAQALEYSARDGSERSLASETVDYRVAPISVDLYFHDAQKSPTDCARVFPQRRELPRSVAMARLLVEALIAAPGSPFPPGSAVQSVVLRDGELTVDFNERLQSVGGSCAVQAIRASVEQTVKQLPAVERVVITAGGSEKLALQP